MLIALKIGRKKDDVGTFSHGFAHGVSRFYAQRLRPFAFREDDAVAFLGVAADREIFPLERRVFAGFHRGVKIICVAVEDVYRVLHFTPYMFITYIISYFNKEIHPKC